MSVDKEKLVREARKWLLASREADRLKAARDEAQKVLDGTENRVNELACRLTRALRVVGVVRTRRIFLPGEGDVPATVVRVTTGSATPSVVAEPVDFVGG